MDNKVYLVSCNDYSQAPEKTVELLDSLGGIGHFVKPDEKIILKTNLLLAAEPEKAVTTHPTVTAAVARLVNKEKACPKIADSPGSGYSHSEKTFKRLYSKCGMDRAAEESGAGLNFDTDYDIVSFPEGKLIKRFEIISPVLKADGIINLCKLKTHSFMSMTGAVKNIFGVIPGRTKPGYHAKLHDTARFAGMLLDLAAYIAPRLSIMDAVVGMEGTGPSAGQPRQVGYLIAATNPLALDVVAGEMMGLPKKDNPVLVEAENRGLKPVKPEEVNLFGAKWEDLKIPDFKLPATIAAGAGFEGIPRPIAKLIELLFKSGASMKPHILRDKCTACGACRDACPVHVIEVFEEKYAQINHKNCIRCYCCHEMCSYEAITLKGGILHRLLNR